MDWLPEHVSAINQLYRTVPARNARLSLRKFALMSEASINPLWARFLERVGNLSARRIYGAVNPSRHNQRNAPDGPLTASSRRFSNRSASGAPLAQDKIQVERVGKEIGHGVS